MWPMGLLFNENMTTCYTLGFILFVWSYSSHRIDFHSYGDVTIAGEGLQILTYARHLWQLSNEGSLACHTYTLTRGIRL